MKIFKKKRLLVYIFITAFITNLIWENAQAPLYTGYKGFGPHFLFCLLASAVDGIVILTFYLIVCSIREDWFWLFNIKAFDIGMLSLFGVVVAILFEKWALESGTWDYTAHMPLIFGIGLMPALQLAILSVVSVYIVKFALGDKTP